MRRDKNKENLKALIDKMFEIAGHPLKFEDVEGRKDHWFQEYTMTEAQNKEWRDWGVKFLKKQRSRYTQKLAENEMAWLDLYCGLKISDSRFANEGDMTKKDVEVMFEAINNPPEPNQELIKAAKEYKSSKDKK